MKIFSGQMFYVWVLLAILIGCNWSHWKEIQALVDVNRAQQKELVSLRSQSNTDHELLGEMGYVVIQMADKLNGAIVAHVSPKEYSRMQKAYISE